MNQRSNVTVFSAGNNEIIVCWQKNPSVLTTGYLVSYTNEDAGGVLEHNTSLSSDRTKHILSNLTAHGNYSVQVSLVSKCGLGFRSEPAEVNVGDES